MSNDPGYKIFLGVPATREKIEAAKSEVAEDEIRRLKQKKSNLGLERLGWGKNSDILLHDSLDLDNDVFVQNLLHGSYKDAKICMAHVVVWTQNTTNLPRVRAGRGRVFIYRAIDETLSPQNGFFRIVEGSHRMTPEQIRRASARDIRLEPGDSIVLDGDMVIEYPQAGGGVGLLKCLEKSG